MNQFVQLENNIRQVRQMVNQINHQLMSSERMVQDLNNQFNQNTSFQGQYGHSTYNPPSYGNFSSYGQSNFNQPTYGKQYNSSVSVNPDLQQYSYSHSSYQNNNENINPISGLSENKPTMRQQAGVNKYGANYSSGNDIGN